MPKTTPPPPSLYGTGELGRMFRIWGPGRPDGENGPRRRIAALTFSVVYARAYAITGAARVSGRVEEAAPGTRNPFPTAPRRLVWRPVVAIGGNSAYRRALWGEHIIRVPRFTRRPSCVGVAFWRIGRLAQAPIRDPEFLL